MVLSPALTGRPYFGNADSTQRSRLEDRPAQLLARTQRRHTIEDTLLKHHTHERLKQQGWLIWRIESTDKLNVLITLDQVDNHSIEKIKGNPYTLERLKNWLNQYGHHDKHQSLTKAISQGAKAIRTWLIRHTKRTHIPNQPDVFVLKEKERFEQELAARLEAEKHQLMPLFKEALSELGVPSEKITLTSRLQDTCCYTSCDSCLSADPKSHKLFIRS